MSDLGAITWWVGILTVLIGIQTVAIAVVAIKGLKLFTRAHTTLDGVDRALEPITQGTRELIQDLHALRETAQRAERGVSAAIDRVTTTTDHVKHAVVQAVLAGVWNGGRRPRRVESFFSAPASAADDPRR